MSTLTASLRQNRLLLWAGLPPAVALPLTLFVVLGSSFANHTPPHSNLTSWAGGYFPLEISPRDLNLGRVRIGETARASLVVRNRQSAPVTLRRFQTSCPCVELAPMPLLVGPSEVKQLIVSLDPSGETDFLGALSVELVVFDNLSGEVFRTRVNAELSRETGRDPLSSSFADSEAVRERPGG